jgi:hypothetical protein
MTVTLVAVGRKITWITSELPQMTVVVTFLEGALSFLYVCEPEFFHFSDAFIQASLKVIVLQVKPLTFF